jgi:hypothetical protein
MNTSSTLPPEELFRRSVGFVQQAYHFFASCLPQKEDEFPMKVNGIYFDSAEHVKVYENELSYASLLRLFGALEELRMRLGIKGEEVPGIVASSSDPNLRKEYSHVKNLRHVIAHGNGDGNLTRNKYAKFAKDRNGDLQIVLNDVDGFVSIVSAVARELVGHANEATSLKKHNLSS